MESVLCSRARLPRDWSAWLWPGSRVSLSAAVCVFVCAVCDLRGIVVVHAHHHCRGRRHAGLGLS